MSEFALWIVVGCLIGVCLFLTATVWVLWLAWRRRRSWDRSWEESAKPQVQGQSPAGFYIEDDELGPPYHRVW